MQIISGKYRGKKLTEYYNDKTRPTTSRVRENIFNVIFPHVNGSTVLDLFAGTGAYGIECFSRGATEVIFNDLDKEAVNIIKKNCQSINLKTQILNLNYLDALNHLKNKQFDIIFLDPPYESDYAEQSVNFISKNKMLKKSGVIILETDIKNDFNFPDFEVKIKQYGRAKIYFITNHDKI